MKQKDHFIYLDILRGLAAVIVLFSHGVARELWQGPTLNIVVGSVGVSIFFTLSGFLMGYLYSDKEFTGTNVYKYIVSRFARIAPAYLLVIIFSYLMFTFVDSDFLYPISNQNILRHLLFSGNVHVFWSIPPEVQFYGFFILIWLASFRAQARQYSFLIIVILISLLCFKFQNVFPGTTFAYHLQFFLFGSFAGFLRKKVRPYIDIKLSKFYFIFIILFLICIGLLIGDHFQQKLYSIFSYSIITAIAIFLLSSQSIENQINTIEYMLILVGKWSFSLYLTHDIVLYYFESLNLSLNPFVNFTICLVFSLLLSWILFEFIEKKCSKIIKNLFDIKVKPQRY